MTLALCIIAKNESEAQNFCNLNEESLSSIDELALVVNPNGQYGGYGTIGHRYFTLFQSDVFGLCHADTTFDKNAFSIFERAAKDGNIVGLVGRALDEKYIWAHNGGGIVSTLDSCSMFLPRQLYGRNKSQVYFDTKTFDHFHCCVEDLCLQMTALGHSVVVPNAYATHLEKRENPPNWISTWEIYHRRLKHKWSYIPFITT